MSISTLKIALYSNLPSGGARELYRSNLRYLKSKANIVEISDSNLRPKGFLSYLYTCLLKVPRYNKYLATKINNKKCDVLVAYHSWLTKSPYILRYTSIPRIYICHEAMREFYEDKNLINKNLKDKIVNTLRLPIKYVDRINVKFSNVVIANSKFSKKIIDSIYGVSSIVIYPGINTKIYAKKVKTKEIRSNQVISVGAINKLKNFHFIIKVLSKVDSTIRPKLVIIGNGIDENYYSFMKKLANELHVNIKIKCNISRKALIHEYQKSKLFIYAPINEPFGIVVEEAMASGLPLVLYKNGGGYAEIVNDANGIILNTLNENIWAESIEKLLNDKNSLEIYCKYNRTYVSKYYNQEIMNDKLWRIIKSL